MPKSGKLRVAWPRSKGRHRVFTVATRSATANCAGTVKVTLALSRSARAADCAALGALRVNVIASFGGQRRAVVGRAAHENRQREGRS